MHSILDILINQLLRLGIQSHRIRAADTTPFARIAWECPPGNGLGGFSVKTAVLGAIFILTWRKTGVKGMLYIIERWRMSDSESTTPLQVFIGLSLRPILSRAGFEPNVWSS